MSNYWDNSEIMKEFEKKAAELGWMKTNINPKDRDMVGNPSKSPVGPFRHEATKDYDVTKETGEELIESAHKKPVEIAKAMGKGGLVENQNEQQEKDLEIALKTPNGALIQVHATLINNLIKIANSLEDQGKGKKAERIDAMIERLSRPFQCKQELKKEALLPLLSLVPYILTGLGLLTGTGIAANFGWFSSWREGITTDIKDLYDILQDASQGKWYSGTSSSSASKAAQLLQPFVSRFQSINFKDDKEIAQASQLIKEFGPAFEQIGTLIKRVELELGESRWFEMGRDRVTRLNEKYQDVVKDLQFIAKTLNQIQTEPKQSIPAITQQPQDLIGQLTIAKQTGNMTPETIAAVKRLEKELTEKAKILGMDKSFENRIVDNGKVVINLDQLRQILEIIKTKG